MSGVLTRALVRWFNASDHTVMKTHFRTFDLPHLSVIGYKSPSGAEAYTALG